MKKIVAVSKLGTEYTVKLISDNMCEVRWLDSNNCEATTIQDKETVVEHFNDGSWKLIDLR